MAKALSALDAKAKNDVIIEICGLIIDGYSRSEILKRMMTTVSEKIAIECYTKAMAAIEAKSQLEAENVIDVHVGWYEAIYRKFDYINFVSGKNAALRQKEKILGLLKDDNKTIQITNEANITLRKDEPGYDVNKLTVDEVKRLGKYLSRIKLK